MSIDPSLRIKGALERHRNVLSRAERIEKLIEEEKWTEEDGSVLGLPKVAHRKSHAGRKEATEEMAAEGVETPETTTEEAAAAETEKTES
ncbi:MAG: small basic protein [Planctomycetota bacterium]|jgi:small basic protein (TIGR04137 family)